MMPRNESPIPFCMIGFLAVAVFCVCWITAVCADPTWKFGKDSLSDMGVSDVPLTADLFMAACIITGLLGMVFSLSKIKFEKGGNRISGYLLLASCFFLIGVGIFNMEYNGGDMHYLNAYLFFGLILLSVIASAVGDYSEGRYKYLAATVGLLVLIFGCVALTEFAMYEAIGVIAAMVWLVLQSLKLVIASLN